MGLITETKPLREQRDMKADKRSQSPERFKMAGLAEGTTLSQQSEEGSDHEEEE